MPLNLRRYARLGFLGLLIAYFSGQALTGERGLLNEADRRRELIDSRAELAALQDQRQELEARVEGLSPEHLSVDLLEERARVVLGYAHPDDFVIRDDA